MLGQVTPALAMMAIPGPGGKVRRVAGLLPQLSESLINKMMKAAKLPHKNGFTKVGFAFSKHGNRPNSPFPAAIGNPDANNIKAEIILNQILRSDNQLIDITPGGQMRIFDRDTKQGVLFDQDGEIFKGFLDLDKE